ncbi:MAG: alpha/beta hydrolase [Planctomycetota bacterium]
MQRALVLLLLVSCAAPPEQRDSDRVRRHYREAAGLGRTGLPASTRALLDERGWRRQPLEQSLALMEAEAPTNPDLRLEAADIHYLTGGPPGAMHAARNAWTWMAQTREPEGSASWTRARRLYNHAVTSLVLGGTYSLPEGFDGVLASWSIPDRGFRQRVTQEGIGASLLGIRKRNDARTGADPFLPEIDVGVALTALVRFDGPRPAFELYDPLVEDRVRAFGRTVSLQADFTAPLAYLFEQVDGSEWERQTVYNPALTDAGLSILEPPRRNKIPVVFIHGLKSNPADFRWMINELRADREVRLHYQFIAYRYPSTLPLPLLSLELRRRLDEFWSWFDARAPGARRQGFVVMGHSLGGLLSKTLGVRSKNELFDAIFTVPRDQVSFDGELGAELEDALFLKPVPKLARLVFLATPHRGSVWAEGATAEVGLNRIEIPEELQRAEEEMLRRYGPQLRPVVRERLFQKATSLDNLRRDDPYLVALTRLPVTVPFDSVIANLLGTEAPPSSDGIVRYESARLDGAESETIVRSGHQVQRSPEGIEAVRRILLRHRKGLDR